MRPSWPGTSTCSTELDRLDASDAAGLPHEYGVDDIPLVVQDRQITADGAFGDDPSPLSNLGVLGYEILVNGTYGPSLQVEHALIRLRILNGSNNRIFDFGFDDDRPFRVIAGDGGMLERRTRPGA